MVKLCAIGCNELSNTCGHVTIQCFCNRRLGPVWKLDMQMLLEHPVHDSSHSKVMSTCLFAAAFTLHGHMHIKSVHVLNLVKFELLSTLLHCSLLTSLSSLGFPAVFIAGDQEAGADWQALHALASTSSAHSGTGLTRHDCWRV